MRGNRQAWFQGGDAECDVPPPFHADPYRLVLLGPPGVGKGTQAELLCEALGACHLSTGDVFRSAARQKTPRPALARAIQAMSRGELVSDGIVVDLVAERSRCLRCGGGFLLDGFPRTVDQAEALDAMLSGAGIGLDAVVCYDLALEEIVGRISGRRTCRDCERVFHDASRAPRVAGVCDACGGNLVQRSDDEPSAVLVRMQAYEDSTKPLIDYYEPSGRLLRITADGPPEAVRDRTVAALALRHQDERR